MGDPSGVGPEIICKALADLDGINRAETVVIGDRFYLEKANRMLGTGLVFVDPAKLSKRGDVQLIDVQSEYRDSIEPGTVSAGGGDTAYLCIAKSVELCREGSIDAIVTAPLNKAALHLAGHHYDGHTGLLTSLTGAEQSFMLLTSEKLSTIHVTTHVSMRAATERITPERVCATIVAGDRHLKQMGCRSPRIAVAGLNPHCGEGGIFGTEDMEQISHELRHLTSTLSQYII